MPTHRNWRAAKTALLLAAFIYALVIALFELAPLDLAIQDRFYDSANHQWLVARDAALPKAIFYTGPKGALIVFGAYLLIVASGRKKSAIWTQRDAICILACMALVPITVAIAKNLTGVCCPWELARYGGEHEHRNLFAAIQAREHCRCYPAGHASGGFGLLGLAFAGRKRSFAPGLAAGWIMGLYQMLRGAHFLSHTLASMFVGLMIASALAWAFKISPQSSEAPDPLA